MLAFSPERKPFFNTATTARTEFLFKPPWELAGGAGARERRTTRPKEP
jgi:hypothetical protein